jgi:hypothetical protein
MCSSGSTHAARLRPSSGNKTLAGLRSSLLANGRGDGVSKRKKYTERRGRESIPVVAIPLDLGNEDRRKTSDARSQGGGMWIRAIGTDPARRESRIHRISLDEGTKE